MCFFKTVLYFKDALSNNIKLYEFTTNMIKTYVNDYSKFGDCAYCSENVL